MGYLTFAAEARVGGAGPVSVEHISASGTPLGFRPPYPGAADLVLAGKQGYFVEGADESQLCARWHLPRSDVSACGSLFRRSPDGGSAGAYVLATALGPIDVAVDPQPR
jgi:hypothetical protein